MTVEEKRARLNEYCGMTRCEKCVLKKSGRSWSVSTCDNRCPDIYDSPESEIDEAYNIVFNNASEDLADNPYWERITAIANRQRSKGIREYGKGVEDDTADINVRLDRIEEELIDALMYLEHLRDGIDRIKEVVG